MRTRAFAALEALLRIPGVDRNRVAAIGYCFGGTTVLELARAGAELCGVVSVHGALDHVLPAQPGAVRARVLVLHGGADNHVNPSVPAFQKEMDNGGVDWEMVTYGGADHAFSVPGPAYQKRTDRRSWRAMSEFLTEVLELTL